MRHDQTVEVSYLDNAISEPKETRTVVQSLALRGHCQSWYHVHQGEPSEPSVFSLVPGSHALSEVGWFRMGSTNRFPTAHLQDLSTSFRRLPQQAPPDTA